MMKKRPTTNGPRWQALPPTSMDRDQRKRLLWVMAMTESIELRRCGVPFLHREQIAGEPIEIVLDGADDHDGFSVRLQRAMTTLGEACITVDACERDGTVATLTVRAMNRGESGDRSLSQCMTAIRMLGIVVRVSQDAHPVGAK